MWQDKSFECNSPTSTRCGCTLPSNRFLLRRSFLFEVIAKGQGGIVLIDEVELQLDPLRQSKIVGELCESFPSCQFILTTNLKSVYLLTDISYEPVLTYGKDSNRILETLMDTPERAENVKREFHRLFTLIDSGQLKEARELKLELLDLLGDCDPELNRASWLIARREIVP